MDQLTRSATEPGTVTVVVPLYRNEATVAQLAERLLSALENSGRVTEVLFVDDACPAGSGDVAAALAEAEPKIHVVRLAANLGQQRAVMIGLAHAAGEQVVVMDGDLQDLPEDVPRLLDRLDAQGGAVFLRRIGPYQGPGRMRSGLLFKRLMGWVAGVRPGTGMFVALDRDVVERLLRFRAPRPYLVGMICLAGAPIDVVRGRRQPRASGRSAYSAWNRLWVGVKALAACLKWRLLPATRSGGRAVSASTPMRESR